MVHGSTECNETVPSQTTPTNTLKICTAFLKSYEADTHYDGHEI